MHTSIRHLFLLLLGFASQQAGAQQYTYNHDPAKMNQITIMESGQGTFTPSTYYQLLHQSYSKRAAVTNKGMYRTQAGSNLFQQQRYGDSIQTYMEKRAAIEALNIADRTGGSADLAWSVEGPKVTDKMEHFLGNINRVMSAGGSVGERAYWLQYYDCYQSAIKAVQDAYMPNAQRKREYLRIYGDVSRKNDLLVQYLVRLSNRQCIRERLSASASGCAADKPDIVSQSKSRWSSAIGMASSQQTLEK